MVPDVPCLSPVIDPERTLFTFPDRVFSYRCAGCAACCKGHGIGLDATGGEVAHLTRAYPQVVAFLRRRGDAMTAFNPRDRCWFLDGDALCRIEREHGRSHKPASCRLFPFNRIYRIGSWAVVDYNSVLCPLEIGGEPAVTHADILAEIATVADRAVIGTSLGSGEEDGRALVERERAIADRLFAAAAAADLDAGWAAQSGVSRPPVDEAFQVMLGAPWTAPDPVTLAGALWLSPSLRFNELYGPRKYAPRDQLLAALPGMWLAWIGFAGLGARLAGRPLGLQELTTIWSEQAPLGYIAARWNDPTAIRPAEPASDPLARRLARALGEGGGASRGAGLTPSAAAGEPAERVAGLKLAEPLLRAAF
jgi:Fe-S-cluster containining protein